MVSESRVLVTGGAGFIGSHLCERLLREDYHVICLDNFSTGSKKNVEHLQGKDFELIEHDVKKPIDLKVDFIFHLASRPSPIDYQENPMETALTDILGTKNMLDLALKNKARFLLTSTSEVYGDPEVHPQHEDYWGNVNPVGPRACYDESKRLSETLTMICHNKNNLDTRIARIFNTYGPKMRLDDGRVIPNFVTQCLTGKPITIFGDGKQTRSMCYVDDMINGLMKLMFTENLSGKIINLGNPNELTIIKLAEILREKTDSKSEIIFKLLPKNDPAKRKPDITRAKKLLGWESKINLDNGLEKTIEWFRKEISI